MGVRREESLPHLNGLDIREFLADYWQQKPLLIKRALPGFTAPMDADELAGLACEEQVESRIITGSADSNDWQLRHGPFDENTFDQLGEQDWTLLVQAVDHYLPGVAALKNLFRFIPDWRLDDVMVSFAATGGSVGPHLDHYDVFLLQGQGVRQWRIGERISGAAPMLPHADLQLLSDFEAVETHTLEAGDILYLPPGYPHWGIALEPCMTYSIGFRAPSHQEILSDYCDHVLVQLDPQLRYSDPGLDPGSNPGLIGVDAVEKVHDIVAGLLDSENIAQWFGRYMTQAKYDDAPTPAFADEEIPDIDSHTVLRVDDASRLAYSEDSATTVLYADGEAYTGEGEHWREFVAGICASHIFTPTGKPETQWLKNNAIQKTLRQLLHRGVFIEN